MRFASKVKIEVRAARPLTRGSSLTRGTGRSLGGRSQMRSASEREVKVRVERPLTRGSSLTRGTGRSLGGRS